MSKPSAYKDDQWKEIQSLNLDPIKIKLMNPEQDEGEPITRDRADELETYYKMFLYLTVKYPTKNIVPTKHVDEMWHAHILDTAKYASDCQNVFGYFLHHFPYFGMRGDEDQTNLKESFDETVELHMTEFGESPLGMRTRCCCTKCYGQCFGDGSGDAGLISDDLTRPAFA